MIYFISLFLADAARSQRFRGWGGRPTVRGGALPRAPGNRRRSAGTRLGRVRDGPEVHCGMSESGGKPAFLIIIIYYVLYIPPFLRTVHSKRRLFYCSFLFVLPYFADSSILPLWDHVASFLALIKISTMKNWRNTARFAVKTIGPRRHFLSFPCQSS